MSDIEQPRKQKIVDINQVTPENDNSNERSRFLVFFTAFFISLLAGSLVLVYFLQQEPMAVLGVSAIANQQTAGFDCDYAEAQKFEPFAGGILKVSVDRVSYITLSEEEIYGFPISVQNPKCVVDNDFAVVYEQAGFFSFLLDRNGLVFQNQMKEPIYAASISNRGFVAYITYREDTKGIVNLVDRAGVEFGRFESNESGFPIKAVFSPGGDVLSVVFINTDASTVHPMIKQFQIRSENGAYRLEQIAQYSPNLNSVLMQVSYSGNRRVFFSGVSDIFYLNEGLATEFRTPYTQIHSVHSNVDGLGVLYSQGGEQNVQFSFLSNELVAGASIVLGEKLIDSEIRGNRMLVAIDHMIYEIDMNGSRVLGSHEIGNSEILKIGFASSETIIVITAGGVRVLPAFKS